MEKALEKHYISIHAEQTKTKEKRNGYGKKRNST